MEKVETIENDVLLNTDEQEITSYEKGHSFEDEFAQFMKRELKWEKVRVGAHMAGKANVKGSAIDVIGERLDQRGKNFSLIGIGWMLISLMSVAIALIYLIMDWGDGFLGLLIGGLMFLGGAFFTYQSNIFNKENAWVECKNLKGKVNINQISKSIREITDYRDSGNKEYKFEYHYFASASGYVENALKYAVDHNIICYQKEGNTFKRVGYWD